MPTISVRPAAMPFPRGRPFSMRLAGVSAAVVLVLVFLGCMSIEIDGFGSRCSTVAGVLCQKGTVVLQPHATQDVYYPVAYCRPPNLELSGPSDDYTLLEQKEDHFQIHNKDSSCQTTVRWKARGVQAGPPMVIVPGPPAPAPTGPAPAAPAPADVSATELPPAPRPLPAPPDK